MEIILVSGHIPLTTTYLPVNQLSVKFYFYRGYDESNYVGLDVPDYNSQIQIILYVTSEQYLKLAFSNTGIHYKFCTDTPYGTWIKL